MNKLLFFISIIIFAGCGNTVDQLGSKIDYEIQKGYLYLTEDQLLANNGINEASYWCHKTGNCGIVMLPFGDYDVKYNIQVYAKTTLSAVQGTVLNLYPTDQKAAAVSLIRRKRFYVENAKIKNIAFVLKSPAQAVIQTNRSHKALIQNCNIEVDEHAPYGIIIGSESEKGALGTLLYNNRVVKASQAAILMLETGGKHRLDEMQVRFNKTGLQMSRGMLVIENSEFDANKEYHIDITAGVSCFINNSTFEKTGIRAHGIEVFSFTGSKMSQGFFDLEAVEYVDIHKSRLNGLKSFSGPNRLSFKGNYIVPPNTYDSMLEKYCDGMSDNYTGRDIKLNECK